MLYTTKYSRMDQVKFFKILYGSFLNTLSYVIMGVASLVGCS